jgi:hypothetical protein
MRTSDRTQSLLWGLFGLYLVYEGVQLKLGTPRAPKPGFQNIRKGDETANPRGAFFLQTFTASPEGKKIQWRGLQWQKGVKMMAALFLYAAVFHWLGFIVSTFLLLLFLFKGMEPQRWGPALLMSAVTVAACYLVFNVFLELQFPPGLLRDIL